MMVVKRAIEWWAKLAETEAQEGGSITAGIPEPRMLPGWESRFDAMKAAALEKAMPLPGERLYGFDDLLANLDLPDGTRMTLDFVTAMGPGTAENHLLEALNAYIEFPNILRRKAERSGMLWHGLSPAETAMLEIRLLVEAKARRRT